MNVFNDAYVLLSDSAFSSFSAAKLEVLSGLSKYSCIIGLEWGVNGFDVLGFYSRREEFGCYLLISRLIHFSKTASDRKTPSIRSSMSSRSISAALIRAIFDLEPKGYRSVTFLLPKSAWKPAHKARMKLS